jgi:lysophospholipase L1-like esterase
MLGLVHQILVYSDSLTWGIVPNTRKRLTFDERWPGVFENTLNTEGLRVRVIEDCLNGRRTVWDDPFKPGRNGIHGLQQRIEICSPLSLVILMLGTNDFQFCHPCNDAWAAAQGIATLVQEIRKAPTEPGMPDPEILIICPPKIGTPRGPIAPKFREACERSQGLPDAFKDVAASLNCHYFDANTVTGSSKVDGVHLDPDQHLTLGKAIAQAVRPILLAQEKDSLAPIAKA